MEILRSVAVIVGAWVLPGIIGVFILNRKYWYKDVDLDECLVQSAKHKPINFLQYLDGQPFKGAELGPIIFLIAIFHLLFSDPRDLMIEAQAHEKQGKMEEAILNYKKVLQNDSCNVGAHFNLGNAYVKCDMFEEAAFEYKEILRLTPRTADAHVGLGVVYMEQERMDEAVKEFKAAVEIEPELVACSGFLHLQMERLDEAIHQAKLASDSGLRPAYRFLSDLKRFKQIRRSSE